MNAISGFELRPFARQSSCVKCGGDGWIERFDSVGTYIRDPNGKFGLFSWAPPCVDHLVIQCRDCGWQWLMEPKDAEGQA